VVKERELNKKKMKRKIKNDFAFRPSQRWLEKKEEKKKRKQKTAKRRPRYIDICSLISMDIGSRGPRRRGQVSGSATLSKWTKQEKLRAHASL
jgi:hypothetical protein